MSDHLLCPDVLCIGESMVLVAPRNAAALDVGATLELHVAGAESNLAIDLVALGRTSAWASLVGSDRFGDIVRDHVEAAGVEVDLVGRGDGRTGVFFKDPSSTGTRVIYYRDGSAATRMNSSLVRSWAERVRPRVVHISGITSQISPTARELCDHIVHDRVFGAALVSFDVNYRLGLAAASTPDDLLRLAQAADVVFVGADEAQTVWNLRGPELPDLLGVGKGGPAHVVVKDSSIDATEFADNGTVTVPALSVDVLEPVGAGDAFAAGWLDGYLDGDDAVGRLARGHAAAARVLVSVSDTIERERDAE